MGRKRTALIQFNDPSLVPGHLQIVGAVDYSGGTPPANLKQVSSYWYNPGDTIPGRYEQVGAVTYASPDLIPASLEAVAAMEPDIVLDAVEYPELVLNGGFETAGPGGFANWSEAAGTGGAVARDTDTKRQGAASAKLTRGTVDDCGIWTNTFAVVPGRTYDLDFYCQGDGTNAPRFDVYNVTAAEYITTQKGDTGVTAAEWTRVNRKFQAPAGCVQAYVDLYPPDVQDAFAYFEDVSVKGPTE